MKVGTNLKHLAALSGENGTRSPLHQQHTEAANQLLCFMLYSTSAAIDNMGWLG